MNHATLITSGTYIGEEMQAEFGRVPPAFLPVGPAVLLQHQINRLSAQGPVWLSLPNDFHPDPAMARLLDERGVTRLALDPRRSLGLSVFQAILEMGMEGTLDIMHGDTLLTLPPDMPAQCVSVGPVSDQYRWGVVGIESGMVASIHTGDGGEQLSGDSRVLSGFFRFVDRPAFLRCLSRCDFDFVASVAEYARATPVAAVDGIEALDFGHLKTYYSSRYRLAAARHFNTLHIDGATVQKKSSDAAKLDAEAYWLRSVPAALKPFTARLIEDAGAPESGQYRTAYANYPTVAELYLARSPQLVWHKILTSACEYLDLAATFRDPDDRQTLQWLVLDKLQGRLDAYPDFLPARADPVSINGQALGTLQDVIDTIAGVVREAPAIPACVMHGDLCFSNMLFDTRSDRIVLIDPRATVDGRISVYGDVRYDIAKLGHSVIGRYDQIIAGHLAATRDSNDRHAYRLEPHEEGGLREWIEQAFLSRRAAGVAFDDPVVRATIVSLFLSMIPLHADNPDRQLTLFANGLRLFHAFFGRR